MREEPFTVEYISVKNCYLYFSDHWIRRLNDVSVYTSVLRLDYNSTKRAYFSWNPQPLHMKDNSVVCLSATYAQRLGISNGAKVVISFHNHVASVSKVYVSPLTYDDYEIVEMNQAILQSSLLDQIQVIWPGQAVVAWVGKSINVALSVDSLEPSYEVGRLQSLTEIIVSLPIQKCAPNMKHDDKIQYNQGSNSCDAKLTEPLSNSVGAIIWHSLKSISSNLWKENNYQPGLTPKYMSENNYTEKDNKLITEPAVYRVHPFTCANDETLRNADCNFLFHPYNAFVHKKGMFPALQYKNMISVYKLRNIQFITKSAEIMANTKKNEKQADTAIASSVYVNLYILEDILDNLSSEVKVKVENMFSSMYQQCIFLSDTLRKYLNLKVGSRVILEKTTLQTKPVVGVQISPIGHWKIKSENLQNLFRNYLMKHTKKEKLLINSGGVIPLQRTSHVKYVSLNIVQPVLQYGFIDSESAKCCKIEISSNNDHLHMTSDNYINKEKSSEKYFRHLEKEINEGIISLEMTLGLQGSADLLMDKSPLSVSNILIVGKSGSGLSTVAKHLSSRMEHAPYFVHSVEVHCRNLKGKKVETLLKLLNNSLQECAYFQPSILMLHDIESLAPAPSQDQDGSLENTYFIRVGEMMSEMLEEFQESYEIALIATAPSASKLNSALIAPRGKHTFPTILTVPDLSKIDRLNILASIVSNSVPLDTSTLDLTGIASKTEGFIVQDLVDFVDKAVFEAWKRTVSDPDVHSQPAVENEDLDRALENTKPLSLRDVELFHNHEQTWNDIGGLQEVKDILVELLEWPVQYTELFSKAPLRLQSGVLLYGAPGTGKTLLAGVVASECGLNFISIKGPELLSKYIGASEEAVRNIFEKAQSAKPCVLFFDEFDSLAPRRGHDSTGVTDRVVNQLLTQLDGVEALQGVWVMAATSRPDLLDPALLRPGRIDKTIHCPLPSENDRFEILKALSCKMCLSEDVDLVKIAEDSKDFTGADLQAVLYTAQLIALESSQTSKEIPENDRQPPSCAIRVSQENILTALADTRPSLSHKEKAKYELIYNKFEKSRRGIVDKNLNTEQQKVTLA